MFTPNSVRALLLVPLLPLLAVVVNAAGQSQTMPSQPIVLHAARLLDVKTGRTVKPGEILVQGERILEVGMSVKHPVGAELIDLGDRTLLPGLIDAHIHLFLHPGAEDLQTVQESVPQRTITATLAARDDLMAGFTAERDMGTEGAGCADVAVRNAINSGLMILRKERARPQVSLDGAAEHESWRLKRELANSVSNRQGAQDRPCWSVKSGQHTVAGHLDLTAPEAFQLPSHRRVVEVK